MNPRHVVLAVAVAVVWGVNFVVIEVGLEDMPPLLLSALRFAAAAFPAALLLGPPRVAWRYVVAVGLVLGVAKFGLLFVGMAHGMPAGLSSLVLQCQAVFTLLFAIVLLGERPRPLQLLAIATACVGIAILAFGKGLTAPAGAFALVIAAGACWGVSNIATRHARPPDTLRFMVWVSAVAVVPLLLLSGLTEGWQRDVDALRGFTWSAAGAVAYLAGAATLFGFGAWGYLLRRYDASTVAPFSLLVPVVGMAAAWLLRGERLTGLQLAASALVITGMAGTAARRRPAAPPAVVRTDEVVAA
ncbi:MAG TPA: EamA family transporter [Kribbellaceae bacterium]